GAIYLDGGPAPAQEFVERLFEQFLAGGQANRADAKTTLQEWGQARGLEPPSYVLVERTGPDHAPEFTIAVSLAGFDPIQATGPSKKIAEHKAAEEFLIRQKVWKEAP
ncbi:MAG: ribonuclease III, partial [Phyllobacteriaceae bacterium]|nr:ribonuclease III [Phyllobacteriaceae bacterium]